MRRYARSTSVVRQSRCCAASSGGSSTPRRSGGTALGHRRIRPEFVEFWQGREGRMRDRLRFARTDEWSREAARRTRRRVMLTQTRA